jgi:hypothetical protein
MDSRFAHTARGFRRGGWCARANEDEGGDKDGGGADDDVDEAEGDVAEFGVGRPEVEDAQQDEGEGHGVETDHSLAMLDDLPLRAASVQRNQRLAWKVVAKRRRRAP